MTQDSTPKAANRRISRLDAHVTATEYQLLLIGTADGDGKSISVDTPTYIEVGNVDGSLESVRSSYWLW